MAINTGPERENSRPSELASPRASTSEIGRFLEKRTPRRNFLRGTVQTLAAAAAVVAVNQLAPNLARAQEEDATDPGPQPGSADKPAPETNGPAAKAEEAVAPEGASAVSPPTPEPAFSASALAAPEAGPVMAVSAETSLTKSDLIKSLFPEVVQIPPQPPSTEQWPVWWAKPDGVPNVLPSNWPDARVKSRALFGTLGRKAWDLDDPDLKEGFALYSQINNQDITPNGRFHTFIDSSHAVFIAPGKNRAFLSYSIGSHSQYPDKFVVGVITSPKSIADAEKGDSIRALLQLDAQTLFTINAARMAEDYMGEGATTGQATEMIRTVNHPRTDRSMNLWRDILDRAVTIYARNREKLPGLGLTEGMKDWDSITGAYRKAMEKSDSRDRRIELTKLAYIAFSNEPDDLGKLDFDRFVR